MKNTFLASLCLCLVLAACEKTETTPDSILADLVVTKTTTAAVQTQQEGIVSRVQSYGSNLCYKFAKYEVKETGTREFSIRAKATNAGDKPGVACAEALYQSDTTLRINAATTGRYLLHFYNQNQLFKTDTVLVNQ